MLLNYLVSWLKKDLLCFQISQTSPVTQATQQQQQALVKVRVIPSEPSTEPAVAPSPKSQPPLSLKISTSHLKRLSSSLAEGLEGSSVTPSPESVLSGMLSDDDTSPFPPRLKKHKAEHKHKKKKHKNKHKRKHKHSRDIDASPSAEKGDMLWPPGVYILIGFDRINLSL